MERGVPSKNITIVAKHVPGDMSHSYASPYAGATVACVKDKDENIQFYSKFTFTNLQKLQTQLGGPKCGLDQTINNEFWEEKPDDTRLDAFKSYVPYYRVLPKEEYPEGQAFGIQYKTWVFDAPTFTQSLSEYVSSKQVKTIIKEVGHINELFAPNTVVFNCSGIGSRVLKGVEDSDVIPIRAQVVIAKAPHINETRLSWKKSSATYMIKRPGTKDEVILGGFYQPNNWNMDILGTETKDILNRIAKYFPQYLKSGQTINDIEILRVVSAFRPSRKSGVRIERQNIAGNVVVHNYGAGGTGFAQGLGMAESAIRLSLNQSKL